MAVGSPRAESLAFMRDICILIKEGAISSRKDYKQYLQETKQWKHSRRYHYSSCLKVLKLAAFGQKEIHLTSAGDELARIGRFTNLEVPFGLLPAEKEFFSGHLLDDIQYENLFVFLSLFLNDGTRFEKIEQLIAKGNLISFTKRKKSEIQGFDFNSRSRRSYLWLITKANGKELLLKETQENELLWVLKRWCKELCLIDELQFSDKDLYSGNMHKKIFFPIKDKLENLSITKFRVMLDEFFGKKYSTDYIYLPRLTYDFCTTFFVKVKTFQEHIKQLHLQFPHEYYLERASVINISQKTKVYKDEYQKYGNYIIVDNIHRDYLVLNK